MRITINREGGNFRFALILFVAMTGCLWSGGQGLYTALQNRAPTTLGYDELCRSRPTARWLVLTNCVLAVQDSAYFLAKPGYARTSNSTRIVEAFIPLRSPDLDADQSCRAVLATKDPRILSTLEQLRQIRNEVDYEQFLVRHQAKLVQHRPVRGLVVVGAEAAYGQQPRLGSPKSRQLSPDYIVLSEGARPNLTHSAGLVMLGLVIGVGMIMVARSKTVLLDEPGLIV